MVEGTRWECFGRVIGGRISRIECARLQAKPGAMEREGLKGERGRKPSQVRVNHTVVNVV